MNKNISIVNSCTGCQACVVVCPATCIKTYINPKGFAYPSVDYDKCIQCGKCLNFCPEIVEKRKSKPLEVLGARVYNKDVLSQSTSGGIFTVLSDYVFENSGYVCGAIFDDSFNVVHVCTDDVKIRDKMRGAKYVQSDLNSIYYEIERALKNRRLVLFTGTPCQVAGIRNAMKAKHLDNDLLITVDLVCHGVPSPGVFHDSLKSIMKRYGEIENYRFRDKSKGWRGQNVTISTKSGVQIPESKQSEFAKLYFESLITRPSCFQCRYKSISRISDITIGDFWGIEIVNKKYDDNKGLSLVLINTIRGQKLIEELSGRIESFQVLSELYQQENLKGQIDQNVLSGFFWKKYVRNGYSVVPSILRLNSAVKFCKKVIIKSKMLLRKE